MALFQNLNLGASQAGGNLLDRILRYYSNMGAGVQEETAQSPYVVESKAGGVAVGYWSPPEGGFGEPYEYEVIPYTGTPPAGEGDLESAASYGGDNTGVYMGSDPDYGWPGSVEPPQLATIRDQLELAEAEQSGLGQPRTIVLEEWVNPINPGVPNLGPVNEQNYQDGDSQIVRHVPSHEQGALLDPVLLQSRFPHVENTNPYYNEYGQYRRNGEVEYVPAAEMPWGRMEAMNWQLQFADRMMFSGQSHGKLADVPASVPYSSTQLPTPGQAGPFGFASDLVAGDEAYY